MGWMKTWAMRRMIDSADSLELNDIVQAVLRRYSELFAQEEVIFLSLPKHDKEERLRIIDAVLSMEQRE